MYAKVESLEEKVLGNLPTEKDGDPVVAVSIWNLPTAGTYAITVRENHPPRLGDVIVGETAYVTQIQELAVQLTDLAGTSKETWLVIRAGQAMFVFGGEDAAKRVDEGQDVECSVVRCTSLPHDLTCDLDLGPAVLSTVDLDTYERTGGGHDLVQHKDGA